MTQDFYDRHAKDFFDSTVSIDMQEFYRPFLAVLPAAAYILDAGCGSGRDAKHFLDIGHKVDAFDASPELCALASRHLGQPVRQARFEDISEQEKYDGIWACASLLHLGGSALENAVLHLRNALKPGGAFYASFKEGTGIFERDGRHFVLQTEKSLRGCLSHLGGLQVESIWQTLDKRPESSDRWINLLCRKNSKEKP